jgi:hypothetical protein
LGNTDKFEKYALWDRYLNKYVSLSAPYRFTITRNVETYSLRFVLTSDLRQEITPEREMLSYYPNPVNEILHVNINSEGVAGISLLNGVGQPIEIVNLVKEQGQTKAQADMQSLPAGIYFLRVEMMSKEVQIHKIFKQ